MITNFTSENLEFLNSAPYVLLLVDPDWNNHKELREQFHQVACEAPPDFTFGKLADTDEGLWGFLRKHHVTNVPAIMYICKGQVKTVISASQNIKELMNNVQIKNQNS